MVAARVRYSTSANDDDTVCCLLAFQEIGDSPMKMQKPVVDFLVLTHEPQSASKRACNLIGEEVVAG